MDKRKLVNIIIKDLEEIKNLSEEVATSQDDSCLVIDLALNRARLLCQEIELLRELVGNSGSMQKETDQDRFDDEEDDDSNYSFPDPELEILHFEERELPETEELPGEETLDEEEDEIVEEDFEYHDQEEDEPELDEDEEDEEQNGDKESEDDDLTETDDEDSDEEDTDEEEPGNTDEELAEDDLTELEDEDSNEEDTDEDELDEEPQQKATVQVTELSNSPQSGIREIHIDDLDDDDEIEPVQFSPLHGSSFRPPMHEIPKPENNTPEKKVIGETFQKERSLNDSIGENKTEPKLTNSPITSLRAAIGLNDRFIFIREIFDNNTEKYNTIIEKLDKMEQIQEAVEFLKSNLTMQKNEASMKFVDLLKRRFTK